MLNRNDWKLFQELVEQSLNQSLGGAELCAAEWESDPWDRMRIVSYCLA